MRCHWQGKHSNYSIWKLPHLPGLCCRKNRHAIGVEWEIRHSGNHIEPGTSSVARNHWQYVIREVVIKISADISALQSRNHGEVTHSGNQVGCRSTTCSKQSMMVDIDIKGFAVMAIKSSAIADLEAFPGKDVYKRYWQEKFFTWQRNFSPGRRSFSPGRGISHLAGEVFHLAEKFLTWQGRLPGESCHREREIWTDPVQVQ